MKLDPETASQLGWDDLRQHLAEHARTPHGKAACLTLDLATDEASIEAAQRRSRQLMFLLDEGRNPPLEPIDEVDLDLHRTAKGGTLSTEGVMRVATAMEISSRLRGFLMRDAVGSGPDLVDMARGSHDLLSLGRELQAAFDQDGLLRDTASPELMRLRRRANNLADSIRVRLERMVRSSRVAAALGEEYVTQRGDRYVLPVRADSRGEVEGIVHDTSQSGATLFIEPAAVVDEGNRLKIARAEEAEEVRRILAGFSREIADKTNEIRDNLKMLAAFDLVQAGVRLGQQMDARLPEVSGQGFDLKQVRHPLMVLAGDPVVANDIRLATDKLALVVTGPNAGGKTVVLKTLGLCCLMAQAGIPIPAGEGSRLGRFESLEAVIGDSQDLSQGLSTFSAHMARIGTILGRAGPGLLVLIDELAADTDPRHGAALAAAILEELAGAGCTALVTTHFEQLKQLPYDDPRFANASVGFDLETMEPTFELHPDLPGRSLTLDIARRLGLPETLIERAAARLDEGEQDLERMLNSLEDERQALNSLREKLTLQREEAEQEVDRARQTQDRLETRRQELLGQGREQLLAEIATVRREVATVIESLRAGQDMKSAVQSSQQLIDLEKLVRTEARSRPATAKLQVPEPSEPPSDLQPGDRVRLTTLDKEGEVTSLDRAGAMVSVRLGSIHTRIPVEQVELVERRKPRVDASRKPGPGPGAHAKAAKPVEVRSVDNTLDLRGRRVDEALDQVDGFLDRLFGAGEPAAFLIHGHGTGALRAAVREYLKTSPYPNHFRSGTPEEGGDGVTVVALK